MQSRRVETVDALYEVGEDPEVSAERRAAQAGLRTCEDRLCKYRAAFDAGADRGSLAGWPM